MIPRQDSHEQPRRIVPFPAARRYLALTDAVERVHYARGTGTGEREIVAERKAFVAALKRQGVPPQAARAEGVEWERALRAAIAGFHAAWAEQILARGPDSRAGGRPDHAA